jgi:16S rRNA (cytosine967-C5)-methyltransferase
LGVAPPPETEPTDIPGCYKVLGDSSGFRFQDIGSQAIVPLLELAAGQTFLDLAAAPGGKFLQAIETPGLMAVACDASFKRLREVVPEGNRCVADATRPLPFAKPFDRVLLDAPCSGTGTIGRNPEIRWRVQPGDLTRYHERQVKMLSEALKMLAPGGRLVYSTCSLEPEENEDVVERVARDFRGRIKLGETLRRTPGTDPGDGFFAAVLKATKE